MPFINMDGWKMHYEKVGECNEETFVFVHGNAASEKWWNRIKPLLPREWNSYFIDLRGFGKSENQKPYTIEQFTKDIDRFVETLGIAPFHYVGHSMGGLIGYMYVAKFPKKLKTLILVDPSPANGFPVTDDIKQNFKLMMNNKDILEMSLRNSVATFLKDEDFFKNVILQDAIRSIPQAYEDTLEAVNNINLLKEMRKVNIPVIFIWGEKDAVIPLEWRKQTIDAFKNKEEKIIKNSSHSPMIENPVAFVETLKDFIRRHKQ